MKWKKADIFPLNNDQILFNLIQDDSDSDDNDNNSKNDNRDNVFLE